MCVKQILSTTAELAEGRWKLQHKTELAEDKWSMVYILQ